MNYFNEFDTHAAEMLRNLRTAGIIPDGRIDARSIESVTPADLAGYDQCHFFAGIGVWSMALRLAGWPEHRRVWTGSCPCQPFSVAGKGKGAKDERHLWPVWFKLIEACRPECLFGEQVASPAARDWYDGVCSDLESIGYTCGAVIVGAHSAGADHQRQRLYWMAYTGCGGDQRRGIIGELAEQGCEVEGEAQQREWSRDAAGDSVSACSVVQPIGTGLEGHPGYGGGSHEPGRVGTDPAGSTPQAGDAGTVGNAGSVRRHQGSSGDCGGQESPRGPYGTVTDRSSAWTDSYPILCRDGKWRRVPSEPAFFPLVDGVASRDIDQVRAILQGMGHSEADVKRMLRQPRSLVALAGKHRTALLRAAGNAIVLQLAAEFITVAMEALQSKPAV